ncbi:MAG TPA: tRNA (N6-isopentenyl adenosine(37)-C2)-methylthiotransferase MiaB [Clostridiales bacterium]|nr:tRNA (N6-isopentenyl adenosine(37)-C2)-methylthiotransferase MiaB [Clostridiales bacterium]
MDHPPFLPGQGEKACIMTFGCQMNENDSEKIQGMLESLGYVPCEFPEEAGLVVMNTCCVRDSAEEKIYGKLGALKTLKKQRPDLILVLMGCMAQKKGTAQIIQKKYRHVDLVLGTHNLHRLPELLMDVKAVRMQGQNRYCTKIEVWEKESGIAENIPLPSKISLKAWVTVMYGCNNFCTYCIVPHVRGRERSRRPEDILNEIRNLAGQGVKEVTLLGQNVNSYGSDFKEPSLAVARFPDLLHQVSEVDGIERIRFVTSHPKDLSASLVEAMAELPKICKHLHLPLQSGSNQVLGRMNRHYTREAFMEKVKTARSRIPGLAVTTDIIVGFPGETEQDFKDTLDVVSQMEFDTAFTFQYSKREGTPAAEMPDPVPGPVVRNRFERLLSLQNEISLKINRTLVDSVQEVLVESMDENNKELLTGRTRTNKIVHFQGDADRIGKQVPVRIDEAKTWILLGHADGSSKPDKSP